ncbi:sigma-70 family RNA polymerase sigma factor [Streptomyces gilvus]|uniref:sigma-70 family RNA polymerase sigma factor n=1 Tax=Streptomyces gilvus TaxID=2920937 RepID=UPI001F0D01D9|nr:sigma-70 family RNA polymerase sigma factor [Streptomyces sp. CME 23]MCH5676109.1 sigma-70 family RNA polymerase sigma factor [Streptomyces sp. CME 23]
MPDGSTAAYARVYEEQQPRLVAYARSLTRNAHAAEDLVAEAHFRVWRRLAQGHEIENVPAYLMTTVRHLATAAGTAVRETPRDPHGGEQVQVPAQGGDPAERVSSVDLVVRVLEQLPERWVKALWLAEAEGQPLAAIGPQLGTKEGATAVLLHRAREGMRQAFLRAQTGAPDDPACQVHWARMPAYVRGAASARQSERLLGHVDGCEDCRARLAALMSANDRLPALVGPALLVLAMGGAGKFLLAFATAGSATGAQGVLHGVRHALGGGSKPVAAAAGVVVVGAAVLVLVLDTGGSPTAPSGRIPVADGPALRTPGTDAPVGPSVKKGRVKSGEAAGTSTPVDLVAATKAAAGTAVSEPRDASTDVPMTAAPSEPAPTPTPTTVPKETDPAPPPTGGTSDEPTPPATYSPPPVDETTPPPDDGETPPVTPPTETDPAPTPDPTDTCGGSPGHEHGAGPGHRHPHH